MITIKAQFYIPDNLHEMEFKNNFVSQLDYMGVIIDNVSIVQNELVPESVKMKQITPHNPKKAKKNPKSKR